MTRLQKKCFYAAAFVHGILFLVLIVGPAFFQKPKPQQDFPIVELIQIAEAPPAATAPAQPVQAQPPPRQPDPPPPRRDPPPPRPAPPPRQPDPPPRQPTPQPRPEPPPRRQITPDLSNRVQISPQDTQAEQRRRAEQAAAQERAREQERILREVRDARNTVQRNLSPSTTVQMPDVTGALFNDYATQVRREYERRWNRPEQLSRERAEVEVQVVINRDGRVHARRVVRRSNVSEMDQSIERLLNAVDRLPPFPAGLQDPRQTFNIVFVLTAL